jgi:hypothetical protein
MILDFQIIWLDIFWIYENDGLPEFEYRWEDPATS